jgi:cytochrome c oxidase assembly factor CtaG
MLLLLAAVTLLACLLPPLALLAREHVAIEALRFALLGYVVPPLLVIGLPPSLRARLAGFPLGERAQLRRSAVAPPGQRHPLRRPRALIAPVAFVATALVCRTPEVVNGVRDHPALIVVEAAALLVTGVALWIELVDTSDATALTPGPLRMATAAISMWSIWIVAYLLGFATIPWYRSFHHVAGGLSLAADQEIACWILWAIPGFVFIPVVFAHLTSWLRKEDGDAPNPPYGLRHGLGPTA